MQQSTGFVDPTCPNHVCKHHKAIYGLKQAHRAWFQKFNSFLIRKGFIQSKADNFMFVYKDNSTIMVLLLYVDDIVLTGSNSSAYIHLFKHWGPNSTSKFWDIYIIFLAWRLLTTPFLFILLKTST